MGNVYLFPRRQSEWINCEQTPLLQKICGIITIKVVFYNDSDIKNNRINWGQKTGKKVRHKLLDIVVIVLFAKLANADDWEEVEIFAKSNEEFLKQYIELENGIPSHDTMQRVMGSIATEYMQNVYKKWNEHVNSNEGETLKKIIYIEGKTMRGNKSKEQKANHIVSA